MQSFVLQYDSDENDVAKSKQRSAFPPNFIHSVDSAHMMMTAVACHEAGLTFAGVHDSFWTHAVGAVHTLNSTQLNSTQLNSLTCRLHALDCRLDSRSERGVCCLLVTWCCLIFVQVSVARGAFETVSSLRLMDGLR